MIDALRPRERDGAIDLPTKHGQKNPRIGDRVARRSFRARTQVSRPPIGVLLLMFKAQRQVRLRRDAIELI
jgi:hypothetical protein